MTALGIDDAATHDLVDERLRLVARDVRRAMLDAIPDGEPHHWLWQLVRSYPSRPGKAIRPALCLAAARAFAGERADRGPVARATMSVACAIELLHNAFLVHDDIADGSEMRRGRPTLSAEHGAELALNAGDALAVLANQVLRRGLRHVDDDLAEAVLDEFDVMSMRTLEGQATELGWRRDGVIDLTPEDYLDLIMHKTCWYTTIHPLRVGALLGTGGTIDTDPMVAFGFQLGAAFQIQDDLLNLTGDEDVYGKEINGDLREGKRTLPLIHLASVVTGPERALVSSYLQMSAEERTPDVVDDIRRLMGVHGSIDFARAYGQGIADRAMDSFAVAFARALPGPDTDFVAALVPYMSGRRS